jgi:hypothetical protein
LTSFGPPTAAVAVALAVGEVVQDEQVDSKEAAQFLFVAGVRTCGLDPLEQAPARWPAALDTSPCPRRT